MNQRNHDNTQSPSRPDGRDQGHDASADLNRIRRKMIRDTERFLNKTLGSLGVGPARQDYTDRKTVHDTGARPC